MARVIKNNVAEGFKGSLGGLVFKQYSYGTVVSKRPDRSKVKLSPRQKAANQRFVKAVAYAKKVLRTPAMQTIYTKQLKKGKSLYHLALADFMKNSV
jgi:hypothetical protein